MHQTSFLNDGANLRRRWSSMMLQGRPPRRWDAHITWVCRPAYAVLRQAALRPPVCGTPQEPHGVELPEDASTRCAAQWFC